MTNNKNTSTVRDKAIEFKLGQKVIVNTGGNDTIAFIDTPIKNVHGYYWKEQNSYCCRFTEDADKLLCNDAVKHEDYNGKNIHVCTNSQYIQAECIKPISEHPSPTVNKEAEDKPLNSSVELFTQGVWELKTEHNRVTPLNTQVWCGDLLICDTYRGNTASPEEGTANAQRIVTAVNNFQDMYNALKKAAMEIWSKGNSEHANEIQAIINRIDG